MHQFVGCTCPSCRGARLLAWEGTLVCPKCRGKFERDSEATGADVIGAATHEVLQIFEKPTSDRVLVVWRRALLGGHLWLVGPPGWLFLMFVVTAGVASFIGTFVLWLAAGGPMPLVAPIMFAFMGAALVAAIGARPFASWWVNSFPDRSALVLEGLGLDGGRSVCPPCLDIAIPRESVACPQCKRKKLVRPPH